MTNFLGSNQTRRAPWASLWNSKIIKNYATLVVRQKSIFAEHPYLAKRWDDHLLELTRDNKLILTTEKNKQIHTFCKFIAHSRPEYEYFALLYEYNNKESQRFGFCKRSFLTQKNVTRANTFMIKIKENVPVTWMVDIDDVQVEGKYHFQELIPKNGNEKQSDYEKRLGYKIRDYLCECIEKSVGIIVDPNSVCLVRRRRFTGKFSWHMIFTNLFVKNWAVDGKNLMLRIQEHDAAQMKILKKTAFLPEGVFDASVYSKSRSWGMPYSMKIKHIKQAMHDGKHFNVFLPDPDFTWEQQFPCYASEGVEITAPEISEISFNVSSQEGARNITIKVTADMKGLLQGYANIVQNLNKKSLEMRTSRLILNIFLDVPWNVLNCIVRHYVFLLLSEDNTATHNSAVAVKRGREILMQHALHTQFGENQRRSWHHRIRKVFGNAQRFNTRRIRNMTIQNIGYARAKSRKILLQFSSLSTVCPDKIEKCLEMVCEPQIQPIRFTSEYVTDFMNHQDLEGKTVLLKSFMSTGKTQWIRDYILSHPDTKVLYLADSKALTYGVQIFLESHGISCNHYQSLLNNPAAQVTVCTMQSIWRLQEWDTVFGLMVMDESSCLAGSFWCEQTNKKPEANRTAFQHYCNQCSTIIAMDAFLGNETYQLLAEYRSNFVFYKNDFYPTDIEFINHPEEKDGRSTFYTAIVNKLETKKTGEMIIINPNINTELEFCREHIYKNYKVVEWTKSIGTVPTIKTYNMDHDISPITVSDVRGLLLECDIFSYNSSITVGNSWSFSFEEKNIQPVVFQIQTKMMKTAHQYFQQTQRFRRIRHDGSYLPQKIHVFIKHDKGFDPRLVDARISVEDTYTRTFLSKAHTYTAEDNKIHWLKSYCVIQSMRRLNLTDPVQIFRLVLRQCGLDFKDNVMKAAQIADPPEEEEEAIPEIESITKNNLPDFSEKEDDKYRRIDTQKRLEISQYLLQRCGSFQLIEPPDVRFSKIQNTSHNIRSIAMNVVTQKLSDSETYLFWRAQVQSTERRHSEHSTVKYWYFYHKLCAHMGVTIHKQQVLTRDQYLRMTKWVEDNRRDLENIGITAPDEIQDVPKHMLQQLLKKSVAVQVLSIRIAQKHNLPNSSKVHRDNVYIGGLFCLQYKNVFFKWPAKQEYRPEVIIRPMTPKSRKRSLSDDGGRPNKKIRHA